MDNITNKSIVTAPICKDEVQQNETVLINRTASREDACVAPTQALLQTHQQSLDALAHMQNATQALQRNLNFSVDDSSGRMMVRVTDASSGEMIRQMPTEEALRLVESLDEIRSLLFEAQA